MLPGAGYKRRNRLDRDKPVAADAFAVAALARTELMPYDQPKFFNYDPDHTWRRYIETAFEATQDFVDGLNNGAASALQTLPFVDSLILPKLESIQTGLVKRVDTRRDQRTWRENKEHITLETTPACYVEFEIRIPQYSGVSALNIRASITSSYLHLESEPDDVDRSPIKIDGVSLDPYIYTQGPGTWQLSDRSLQRGTKRFILWSIFRDQAEQIEIKGKVHFSGQMHPGISRSFPSLNDLVLDGVCDK